MIYPTEKAYHRHLHKPKLCRRLKKSQEKKHDRFGGIELRKALLQPKPPNEGDGKMIGHIDQVNQCAQEKIRWF